jgi:hypothetical protein
MEKDCVRLWTQVTYNNEDKVQFSLVVHYYHPILRSNVLKAFSSNEQQKPLFFINSIIISILLSQHLSYTAAETIKTSVDTSVDDILKHKRCGKQYVHVYL